MTKFSERTEILLGKKQLEKFAQTHVFLAGVGGVGSYVAEALTRAGIGKITILDADAVTESNINRQLLALHSNIGRPKVEVMKERMVDINPNCQVRTIRTFIRKESIHEVFDQPYDVVVDAIDVFNPKLGLLTYAYQNGFRVYSSLGAGNKMDPTKIQSGDLFTSQRCRLGKVLRKKLRQEGITKGITAVWSTEDARPPKPADPDDEFGIPINGTISTIPSIFGLTLAGLVLRDLVQKPD